MLSLSTDRLGRDALSVVERSLSAHRPVLRGFREWMYLEPKLASGTVHYHLLVAREFFGRIAPATPARRALRSLTGEDIERYVAERCGTRASACSGRRYALRRLLKFCAEKGWVDGWLSGKVQPLPMFRVDSREAAAVHADGPTYAWESAFRCIETLAPGPRRILEKFGSWLRERRDLSPSTVQSHLRGARAFCLWLHADRAVVAAIRRVTAAKIEQFLVAAQQKNPGGVRAALRHFLRFCVEARWMDADLVGSIPTILKYRLSTVPKGLSDEQVARALDATSDRTPAGARDQAILLLLATYGVRCGHVSTLRLQAVDWERRTIAFPPHKGGKAVAHALTPAAASALAHYLEHFRPQVPFDEVFLRVRPPCVPLSPHGVSSSIRLRLAKAGIAAGAHAFRHAFATRVLRHGEPLKAIADLLGHRAFESSAIYAKVDLPGLRQVAVEWPEALK